MINIYSLEKRFITRLEKTQHLFGYISLETIVNSYFKHYEQNNTITFKRIYSINKMPILKSPPTKQFRDMLQQQNNLRMNNKK